MLPTDRMRIFTADNETVLTFAGTLFTIETARAFGYRALAACTGLPKGAGGRGEIHKLTAAACLYAGEAFNKAVTEACHIHGGSGYMQDTEINRLFRANKLLEIGAGTSEVRKIIIAEELLRA